MVLCVAVRARAAQACLPESDADSLVEIDFLGHVARS
jgi:hypothetical protein